MSQYIVHNCYDSHIHWLATGQIASAWNLRTLSSAQAIQQEKIKDHYFQGDWLVGFGWDNSSWPGGHFPCRQDLDRIFPEVPVALSRVDGHALWVNSLALKKMGILNDQGQTLQIPQIPGGRLVTDENGDPTGVLIDQAKSLVESLIPEPGSMQVRSCLLKACQDLNRAGFTHIRDMTCSEAQWNETTHLAEAGLLTLAVEQTFSAEDPHNFDKAFQLALRARQSKLPLVRVQAIKVYYDGALGSEGALLSQDYPSGSGRGLELLNKSALQGFMRQAWEVGLDLAVHVIGDEAAHRTVVAAHELWEKGLRGTLHLEHVEILRPETIRLMKPDSVICHLQPCHWLSDRQWLMSKLGGLYSWVFPWRALQEAGIPFFFGSDSPIESPSLANNLLALNESAVTGIPKLLGDPLRYHCHGDGAWVPGSFTHFEGGVATSVVFGGIHL